MPIAINGTGTITGISVGGLPDATITPAELTQPLTAGTIVNTTSGTSIDFTGIPSWVKRITVVLSGVSTNGSSVPTIQIGAGSVTTSGYVSASVGTSGGGLGSTAFTSGFGLRDAVDANRELSGNAIISLVGNNAWVASYCGSAGSSGVNAAFFGGGRITLGGTLDRIRLTTQNGTDSFDGGSVNILYE
jgi:hypothetical protein